MITGRERRILEQQTPVTCSRSRDVNTTIRRGVSGKSPAARTGTQFAALVQPWMNVKYHRAICRHTATSADSEESRDTFRHKTLTGEN